MVLKNAQNHWIVAVSLVFIGFLPINTLEVHEKWHKKHMKTSISYEWSVDNVPNSKKMITNVLKCVQNGSEWSFLGTFVYICDIMF